MKSADPATPSSALLRAASIANAKADTLLSNLTTVAGGLAGPVAFTDTNVQTFGSRSIYPWMARRMAMLTSGITGSKALSRAVLGRSGVLSFLEALGNDIVSIEIIIRPRVPLTARLGVVVKP